MNTAITDVVKQALAEDIGTGDVSADLLNTDARFHARIISRQKALLCGCQYATEAFLTLDNRAQIKWLVEQGQWMNTNDIVCEINATQNALLTAERTALNFLQMLSATATQTRLLVDKIAHTSCQLLDTRKTIPNLRAAQKHAVVCGGGVNHRFGLFDMVMLKENHIRLFGGITPAIEHARKKHPQLPLVVEVENIAQLNEVLRAKASISRILCDNFTIAELTQAVKLARGNCQLEASGNIDEQTIVSVAESGVDFISIGALTKNITAVDFSMQIVEIV